MRRRMTWSLVVLAVAAALVLLGSRWWTAARADQRLRLPAQVLVAPGATAADLRGRPAIVHYWASWCEPCRREAPELRALQARLGGRARLVGVDVADSRAAALAFVRRHGWRFPMLSDDASGASGARAERAVGLPTTLLVGSDGRIERRLYGPQTARGLLDAIDRIDQR